MAYNPRLFSKDGQTVYSEDVEHEIRLLWEGWAAGPEAPLPRESTLATLADLDALEARLTILIGSGGGGTATTPYSVVVDPVDSGVVNFTTGIGAQFDPNDSGVLFVEIGPNATLDATNALNVTV